MRTAILFVALAACGSDPQPAVKMDAAPKMDGKPIDSKPIDASIDAPPDGPTAIVRVACPTTPDLVVTTGGAPTKYIYTPNNQTIQQGQIVEFTMPLSHDVFPDTGTDPGIHVKFGEDGCRQFMAKGTFPFHCSVHLFAGSITVN